jgi:hypothetical protein
MPVILQSKRNQKSRKEKNMSNLHKIQIDKESHPKSYKVEVQDVVQCYLNYALTSPPLSVPELSVSIDQRLLEKIGVLVTSDLAVSGSGQISAFIYVQDEGLDYVRITVDDSGQASKEYAIAFMASRDKS